MLGLIAVSTFVLALSAAAVSDMIRYEIPNSLSIALVAAFALIAPTLPAQTLMLHAVAGLAVFAGAALLFVLGVWGGGDAKLVAATALWMGWGGLAPFLLLTALCGAAVALTLLVARRLTAGRALPGRWHHRLLAADEGVPYGVAIALSGLTLLLWPSVNAAARTLI